MSVEKCKSCGVYKSAMASPINSNGLCHGCTAQLVRDVEKWKKKAKLATEAKWKAQKLLKDMTVERDMSNQEKNEFVSMVEDDIKDLRDENLRLKAVCDELGKYATTALYRAGISATHEDCPACKTRGFTDGVACEECEGLGRRKLKEPVMREIPFDSIRTYVAD